MVNSVLKGLKGQGHTDGSSEYKPGQASGEVCKVDVGTRPHQVTLGGASHTAYVKTAVPSDSAALEPLSLPGQLGSVAQGNRCLKPENLLPCPSLYPKRTKDPSSQPGLTVRSSLLFGWPQGQGQRKGKDETGRRQRWNTFLSSPHNLSFALEFTYGGWGVSQGTKQYVKGILWV